MNRITWSQITWYKGNIAIAWSVNTYNKGQNVEMMIIFYIILLLLLRQDTYTLNSFTNSSMVVWSPSPVKIKAHPFFARLRAIPSPIPLVEPVTKATLPLKSITKTLQLFWLSFNVCSMIYKYRFTTFEDNLLSMYLWSLLLVWKLLLENCTC